MKLTQFIGIIFSIIALIVFMLWLVYIADVLVYVATTDLSQTVVLKHMALTVGGCNK